MLFSLSTLLNHTGLVLEKVYSYTQNKGADPSKVMVSIDVVLPINITKEEAKQEYEIPLLTEPTGVL